MTSKSRIPAAIDTFKDDTIPPERGIRTPISQFFRTSRRTPFPSPPRTSAAGRGSPVPPPRAVSPSGSAATAQYPASFTAETARAMFVTRARGRVSMAPAAAFATVGLKFAAESLGQTAPPAPSAAAVLRIAPRLRGS